VVWRGVISEQGCLAQWSRLLLEGNMRGRGDVAVCVGGGWGAGRGGLMREEGQAVCHRVAGNGSGGCTTQRVCWWLDVGGNWTTAAAAVAAE